MLSLVSLAPLLIGCSGSTLSNPVPKPSVELSSVEVARLSLDSATLRWNLDVTNPYWVSVPVESYRYGLDVDQRELLQGESDTRIEIPASSTETVSLNMKVPFSRLLSQFSGYQTGDLVPYSGHLTISIGTPLLGSRSFTVSREGQLPVPAVPRLSIRNLSVSKMGFTQTEARAEVILQNPNSFDFTISSFRMDLALEGSSVLEQNIRGERAVSAGEEAVFPITLSFSPTNLGSRIYQALKEKEIEFQLRGDLQVGTRFGDLSLPLNKQGTIPFSKI